jgi:hypothetical protein
MMEIWTLYFEELKATMRGRFAWLGAAVILLAVGGLATVGTQDTWLDGYGIIAYCLVPLGFIPFATGAIASPRANRFLESVFTAPVERSHWLAAKTLVLLTFAAAYYLALLPMLAVYTYYVRLPLLLAKFLVWAPCLLVASIAVGTLVGVLFIGRNIAPPAATGMGVLDVHLPAAFRGKLIGTYSTGMKRRVEIARALMGHPKVLFLDEPTRGLDLPAQHDVWNLLRRLAATEEVTTFLSSHDAQEIRSLCSEISVIASGRLVFTGATRDLGDDLDAFESRLIELLRQGG